LCQNNGLITHCPGIVPFIRQILSAISLSCPLLG
jgi:hypothetical protein